MESTKLKSVEIDATNQRKSVSARPKIKKPASKKSKRNPRPPRAVRLSHSERRMQPARPSRMGVSVTVNVAAPRLHPKIAAKLPKLPKFFRLRRPLAIGLTLVAVFVVGFTIRMAQDTTTPDSGKVAAAERTEPDFKPLMPSAEQASATQYDGKRNMLSYAATFSGVRLTVSQQPVPARFANDPKAITAAADSINAKQRIDTGKGPIYIATNEDKTQLAVFGDTQVLLFIHTDRQLDDASWKAFIELLKPKS